MGTPGAGDGGPCFLVELELPDGGRRRIRASPGEHVLDAARRAGLELPSLCEQGWDLACAVRVLEGSLDHADARRYFAEDEAAGFGLICTARPGADLRLRTHQAREMAEHRRRLGLPAPRGV